MSDRVDHPQVPDPVPPAPLSDFEYDEITSGERIGTGGDADVYQGTVTRGGTTHVVAIKEPRFSGTIQQRVLERFRDEAETWQRLSDHDNVVTVYAWGVEPLPWLALEYMDGGTLAAELGEFEVPEALWLAGRIAEGVRYGHRHGVAHMDIKPANILLRETGADTWAYPKVSDWGLAKMLLDHSHSVEGISPTYAAPEQFDTETFGPTDDITDVYQFGAVTYALLTGQPPFTGPATAVMRNVLNERPDPPSAINPDVPTMVDDIVMKALAKEKDDRYQGLLPLRNELDRLFEKRVTDAATEFGSDQLVTGNTFRESRGPTDTGPDTGQTDETEKATKATGGGGRSAQDSGPDDASDPTRSGRSGRDSGGESGRTETGSTGTPQSAERGNPEQSASLLTRRRVLGAAGLGGVSLGAIGLGGLLTGGQSDGDDEPSGSILSTDTPVRGGGGGVSDDGGGSDGGADATSEQDFLWWTMRGYIPAETEGIREAASGFEDAADRNVNLTVEVITWDSVFEEWDDSLQSRSLPNASEMAGEHAVNFGHQGVAQPTTDLFGEYDGWYEAVSNWGRFDGDVWGIPWFTEVRTSHVNMDILDEAGVDSPPGTWAEIVETGQAISENTDVSAGWTTGGAQDWVTGQNVSAFNHQAGGQWYSYEGDRWSVEADSAGSLFTHLWQLSMREQWDIAPDGWGSVDGTSANELYQSGETGIAHVPTDLARSLIDPQDGVSDEYADIAEATELTEMPAGPTGESHSFTGGSCIASFSDDGAQYDAGADLSSSFIDYMTQPEQLNNYFPVAAPTFVPVREGQEEMELYTNNPTEIPDQWLETRLAQAPNAVRYGITGAGRCAPFLGSLEGSTSGYSVAMSAMIGNDADPKQALRDMGNNMRSTINEADYVDTTLEEKSAGPSLDDAPDAVQDWITGDGKPQIYNPYR